MMNPSKSLTAALATLALILAAPMATAADLKEIRAKGELRHIGIRYANFVTASGGGFDVDLVRGFANHLGVRYTLVYSDFHHVIRDLLGKDVVRRGNEIALAGDFPVKGDMIASGFTVLPWRETILLYSTPTFPSQVVLVARNDSPIKPIPGSRDVQADIEQTRKLINKKSLLVMERTCLDPSNYGLKSAVIDLRSYTRSNNLNEMVPALINKEAELSLLDLPDAILDLKQWAGRIKILGPVSEPLDLAAAFPKDAPELRRAFNEYLEKVKADGTYDKLVKKYYPGARHYFPAFFGPARFSANRNAKSSNEL